MKPEIAKPLPQITAVDIAGNLSFSKIILSNSLNDQGIIGSGNRNIPVKAKRTSKIIKEISLKCHIYKGLQKNCLSSEKSLILLRIYQQLSNIMEY